MAVVEQVIEAAPERIFAVLADGWTYSDWVVGSAHISDVDADWPAPGSQIHHTSGPWPMSLHDRTVVLACQEPTELHLKPHLWPLGEVEVRIRLTRVREGATRVTIAEDVAAGPLRWLRSKVNDLALHQRNRESLRRLADLATRRKATGPGATGRGVTGPDATGPGATGRGVTGPDATARDGGSTTPAAISEPGWIA